MDVMKGLKKRVSAFLLAVSLSFGLCATDYLEVQAIEWAGVTIGLDTALKFLLGLVGVSVGVGVADEIDWQTLRENCVQEQIAQGNSANDVSNWWADVIHGSLNTASFCWSSFQEWVKNDLLSSSSSAGVVSDAILSVDSSFSVPSSISDYQFDNAIYDDYTSSGGNHYVYFYFFNGGSISCRSSYFDVDPVNGSFSFVSVSYTNGVRSSYSQPTSFNSQRSFNVYASIVPVFGDIAYNVNPSKYVEWVISGSNVGSSAFESDFANISDIALAPDIATDLPYEGVIDIPWENVGATDTAVDDAIDSAQDKVQTGEWSLDKYWTWVQNVTNVFAYDITNNYLLPNYGNNDTADDKVQENKDRMGFTLVGLENVFPFCIPWDIYAFMTLLVAEPVAPLIEYPIRNPTTGQDEYITVDFSEWESVVILFRYIFDFLFIIGLLLLARGLIGAGGSD